MNQQVMDICEQREFPFLSEAIPPTLAALDDVANFGDEVDAINYSVDLAMRQRRGLTHMGLAGEMKITRAVFSKMRQGQVAVPVNKLLTFVETTKSYALLQFYAMRSGLVLKTRDQEQADKRRIAELEARLDNVETKYRRVVGE